MRIVDRVRQANDEIANVDTTGGDVEAIKLEVHSQSTRARKVKLRLRKSGVSVEMTFLPDEAETLIAELKEALRWTRER